MYGENDASLLFYGIVTLVFTTMTLIFILIKVEKGYFKFRLGSMVFAGYGISILTFNSVFPNGYHTIFSDVFMPIIIIIIAFFWGSLSEETYNKYISKILKKRINSQ